MTRDLNIQTVCFHTVELCVCANLARANADPEFVSLHHPV